MVTHTLGSSRALGQDLWGDTLPLPGGQEQHQHSFVCPSCISSKTITNLLGEHSPESQPGEATCLPTQLGSSEEQLSISL